MTLTPARFCCCTCEGNTQPKEQGNYMLFRCFAAVHLLPSSLFHSLRCRSFLRSTANLYKCAHAYNMHAIGSIQIPMQNFVSSRDAQPNQPTPASKIDCAICVCTTVAFQGFLATTIFFTHSHAFCLSLSFTLDHQTSTHAPMATLSSPSCSSRIFCCCCCCSRRRRRQRRARKASHCARKRRHRASRSSSSLSSARRCTM